MINFSVYVHNKVLKYNGTQLTSMFPYKLSKGTSNIVAFRGPMDVRIGEMIDSEDVVKNDPIWSDDAINFILELPFTNIVGAVAIQRTIIHLFAAYFNDLKQNKDVPLYVDGDDILSGYDTSYKKYSVSIATQTAHSSLIHIGLNLHAGKKAPKFAGNLADFFLNTPESSSSKLTKEEDLMRILSHIIKEELNSIYSATLKVLPL